MDPPPDNRAEPRKPKQELIDGETDVESGHGSASRSLESWGNSNRRCGTVLSRGGGMSVPAKPWLNESLAGRLQNRNKLALTLLTSKAAGSC
jgi:hypothetical protein